jgi:cyclopropane-fatty-acyl-phospholipid synthase
MSGGGAAGRLAGVAETLLGGPLPIRLRAWDGSEAGAAGPGVPVAVVRNRRALRRLLWSPGELGLARAFVAGDLEVEGDLADGLHRFRRVIGSRPSGRRWLAALGPAAARLAPALLGPPPRPPASEARLRGRLHTTRRDRAAIAHHYDLGNEFYELLLDPNMAYSCAYWTREPGPDYGVEQAQRDKLDLVCGKLGLRPGMRLLDVGCGWSSLAVHAAAHYGVRVTGVTLSHAQREYGQARLERLGLADRVDVRVCHYRELPAGGHAPGYDAIASLEMGEHVGERDYPGFAATLLELLRPGGRLLLQQMSRGAAGADAEPGGGAFIERYIAPDMHMRPLGETVGLLERAGHEVLDVHALREHYVWTVRAWLDTLERRRAELTALVGPEGYRVWTLYLVGAALAFEHNRMGVHQVLTVRPGPDGAGDRPGRRREEGAGSPSVMPTGGVPA